MTTVNINDFIGRQEEYKEVEDLKVVGVAPVDCSDLFLEMTSLRVLDVTELDTSNTEDMSHMFCWCFYLKSLDLSRFNTSKVKTMKGMFSNCWDLEEIKGLENFDTDALENARWMFSECTSLENFDTSKFEREGIDKKRMYNHCKTAH